MSSSTERLILKIKKRKKKSGAGKMSEIWQHFKLAVPGTLQAACLYCGKIMMRKDSSTKSMWGHLNAFHRDVVSNDVFMKKRKKRCSYKKVIPSSELARLSENMELGEASTSYGSTSELMMSLFNHSNMGEDDDSQDVSSSTTISSINLGDRPYKAEIISQQDEEGGETKNIVKITMDAPLKGQINQISAVWKHFELVSPHDSLQVCCNHCGKIMNRSDRSTKSMWGHLRAYHRDTVGEEIFLQKQKKRNQQDIMPCVEEVVGEAEPEMGVPDATKPELYESLALESLTETPKDEPCLESVVNENQTLDHMDALEVSQMAPGRQDEASSDTQETADSYEIKAEENDTQNHIQNVFALTDDSYAIAITEMPVFLAQNANDFDVLQAINTPIIKQGTHSFELTDPEVLSEMLNIAIDLDLTFSCHGRRGPLEVAFESNRTAERSGGRGRKISLVSIDDKILMTERVNGFIIEAENWVKTDASQLLWAVRGKCQKSFSK